MKKKCFNCKKKIKMINYECRCKNTFCIKCRLPENHNCSFDFKTDGKNNLSKKLIKVTTTKIIQI
jgi:AN1-type zinc finger protein 5/6